MSWRFNGLLPRPPMWAPPVLVRSLLPFEVVPRGASNRVVLSAEPWESFKPRGLMIWGAPVMSNVTHILIGGKGQLVAGVGPIPTTWFNHAKSYEEVWRLHQQGIDPPGWGDFGVVMAGMRIDLHIEALEGDSLAGVQCLMWGESLR